MLASLERGPSGREGLGRFFSVGELVGEGFPGRLGHVGAAGVGEGFTSSVFGPVFLSTLILGTGFPNLHCSRREMHQFLLGDVFQALFTRFNGS